MIKGIAAICLAVGIFVIPWSKPADATHIVPETGMEATVGNICYGTKEYYEEIHKTAKDQGFEAGKDKYWEIMSDKDTPCYAGVMTAVVLVEMVNEVKNLETLTGKCFNSQIWEVFLVSANPTNQTAYTNWHVKCPNEV